MTAWKLLYHNQMPANHSDSPLIDHYRATDGIQTRQAGQPGSLFDLLRDLTIGNAGNLQYELTGSREAVIGLDVSISVAPIELSDGPALPLFKSGDGQFVILLRNAEDDPEFNEFFFLAELVVLVAGDAVVVQKIRMQRFSFKFRNFDFRRLQVHWQSTGQLSVKLDDTLIAYEPSIAVNKPLTLDSFTVGDSERAHDGVVQAVISEVRVLTLREQSALHELVEQLGLSDIDDFPHVCEKKAIAELAVIREHFHQMMNAFNETHTRAWRQEDPGTPFSDVAVSFHDNAGALGRSFVEFLRDDGDGSLDQFSEQYKSMVHAIAQSQPEHFKQCLEQIEQARGRLGKRCIHALNNLDSKHDLSLKLLASIQASVEDIVKSASGDRS